MYKPSALRPEAEQGTASAQYQPVANDRCGTGRQALQELERCADRRLKRERLGQLSPASRSSAEPSPENFGECTWLEKPAAAATSASELSPCARRRSHARWTACRSPT